MRPLLPPRHCSRWIFDTHRVPDERVFRLENSSTRLLPVPDPLMVVSAPFFAVKSWKRAVKRLCTAVILARR